MLRATMKREKHRIWKVSIFAVALVVGAVIGYAEAETSAAVQADTDTISKKNMQSAPLNIFNEIFDDPVLQKLYHRALGAPGHSVIVKVDSSGDSTQVYMDVRMELQEARKELERARQELENLDPEMQKEMQGDLRRLEEALNQTLNQLDDPERLKQLEKLENMEIHISTAGDRPFLGISVADLDFKEAYERHYNYNYGVLVSGVVDGTPADKAGLRKGDIIMEFNGGKARYRDILKNMIDSKDVGDTVLAKIFRNEEIFTTTIRLEPRRIRPDENMETSRKDIEIDTEDDDDWDDVEFHMDDIGLEEGFLSRGYGGGSWVPIYSMADLTKINDLIASLDFTKIPESGVLMHGGAGQGPIGKGWFIGGMGAGYSFERKISPNDSTTRRLNFSTGMGGVTLDKRYRPSENFVIGPGMMIGGSSITMEVAQTEGSYDWNTLNQTIASDGNSYLKLEKSYFMVQPRITMMYRVLPWLAIRSQAGYLMGFSFKSGWDAKIGDETFDVKDAPDSNIYQGFTVSIGPWFGF